jgi:hypothetical protein
MISLRQQALALALAATLATTSLTAHAHNELSESSALSALPVVVSVAAPASARPTARAPRCTFRATWPARRWRLWGVPCS